MRVVVDGSVVEYKQNMHEDGMARVKKFSVIMKEGTLESPRCVQLSAQ